MEGTSSSIIPSKLRVCKKCNKLDSQFRCLKCKTCYCCSECQRLDWPSHKIECILISIAFEVENSTKVEKLSDEDMGLAIASARATDKLMKSSHPANEETKDEYDLRSHVELVNNILSCGEPINGRPGGPVPIIGATERREIYLVRALIIRGADVNKRNSEGKSAIDVCTSPSIRAILLANGATL